MKLSEIIKSNTVSISSYRVEKAIREFAEIAPVVTWEIESQMEKGIKTVFTGKVFTQEDIFYHLCDTVGYVHFGYINPVFNKCEFIQEVSSTYFRNTVGNSVKGFYIKGTLKSERLYKGKPYVPQIQRRKLP